MTTVAAAHAEAKAAYPSHIVLVESARGHYECFGSDANDFGTLCKRICANRGGTAVCGTTGAKMSRDLRRLTKAGRRVVVVKLVGPNGQRAIESIVTPGSLYLA